MEKLTLTRKEAAAILGISTATVTQWVKSGRLRAIKISEKEKSRYLFTREDCIAALEHEQAHSFTRREFIDIASTTSMPPTAFGNQSKSEAAKRLEELLKQRGTNAKRRTNLEP